MKKIELCATAKLIRTLLPALEQAGVRAPLSITPMSEAPEAGRTKTRQKESVHTYWKCELIAPDSLADHVVEVIARLPKELRLAGLLNRLVILEIDECYYLGSTAAVALVNHPRTARRSSRFFASKELNQPK